MQARGARAVCLAERASIPDDALNYKNVSPRYISRTPSTSSPTTTTPSCLRHTTSATAAANAPFEQAEEVGAVPAGRRAAPSWRWIARVRAGRHPRARLASPRGVAGNDHCRFFRHLLDTRGLHRDPREEQLCRRGRRGAGHVHGPGGRRRGARRRPVGGEPSSAHSRRDPPHQLRPCPREGADRGRPGQSRYDPAVAGRQPAPLLRGGSRRRAQRVVGRIPRLVLQDRAPDGASSDRRSDLARARRVRSERPGISQR